MVRSSKWLAAVSGLALATAPVMAQTVTPQGTPSGQDITNTVTVNYSVGAVTQNQIAASDTFKVDRKINVTVATVDTAAVSVSPGQSNAVTTFTVSNNSNDTLDFILAAANQASGGATFGGTDNFDVTNVRIYRDTNGTPGWQTTDTLVTAPLGSLASGASATIFVVSDIIITPGSPPVLPANGNIATVTLTATASSGATPITQTPAGTANGVNTVETVFADQAGITGDVMRDGKHSARSDYQVSGAQLTVAKYSRVIDDYLGSTNPRLVPGALVEYCIVVSNATGAAQATSVAVADIVPSAMTYATGTVYLNGAFTPPNVCAGTGGTGGTDAANYNSATRTVSSTFPSIGAGETRTLRFRATIN